MRLLIFSTWRLALFESAAAHARARPGARRDRRQGRQRARLPPRLRGAVGGAARRRHRPVAREDAGGPRRPVAATSRSCSSPTRTAARGASTAARSTPVLDTVLATAGLGRPRRRSALVGGRAGRDGVHTEAMGYMLAELQSRRPRPPGRDVVSASDPARRRPTTSPPPTPGPGAADADHRRPRHPARRRGRRTGRSS